MSIAILLVTHGHIGQAFLETAQYILKKPIVPSVMCLAITAQDMSVDSVASKIQTCCDEINQGEGVLLLSDLVGATPYNGIKIAIKNHHQSYPLRSVTGLNLAMLLKAINEVSFTMPLSLDVLEQKVQEGGRRSIIVPT